MARVRGFGELEASIMDRLWNRDPDSDTTVREIFDELSTERHIAYTTVMSTMDNLRRSIRGGPESFRGANRSGGIR